MPNSFAKYRWPQDILVNPPTDGWNQDRINKAIGREPFCFATTLLALSGNGALVSYVFQVPPSCNFIMFDFAAVGVVAATGVFSADLDGTVSLIDNYNNNTVINNVDIFTLAASTPQRGFWERPYIFKAGNSITLNVRSTVYTAFVPTLQQFFLNGSKDFNLG